MHLSLGGDSQHSTLRGGGRRSLGGLRAVAFQLLCLQRCASEEIRLHIFLTIAKGIERAQEWFLNIFE